MNKRNILIYLSLKYQGDWDKIYYDIMNHEIPEDEEEIIKVLNTLKDKCITFFDEEYPEGLKNVFKPPLVLYYKGDISLLDCKLRSIAVVGSRRYTSRGELDTRYFVRGLSKNMIIISGLARGIDAIAHSCCLENGGKTIGVLGCGINYVYPLENKNLYNEVAEKGLIISEFPDMTPPSEKTFPIRNRIIAGLTNNVLIPEGKLQSGTSITARLVLENNGNVFCVPTNRGEDSLCNCLIKNGATLVEYVNDIEEEIQFSNAYQKFD